MSSCDESPVDFQAATEAGHASLTSARRRRHAVLVVHGIGSHRITDTARTFAETLYKPGCGDVIYYAQSRGAEGGRQRLYKINWRTNAPDRTSFQPQHTDIIEAFWAYHFTKSAWSHIDRWLRPIVTGAWRPIPTRLGSRNPELERFVKSFVILALSVVLVTTLSMVPIGRVIARWWWLLGLGWLALIAIFFFSRRVFFGWRSAFPWKLTAGFVALAVLGVGSDLIDQTEVAILFFTGGAVAAVAACAIAIAAIGVLPAVWCWMYLGYFASASAFAFTTSASSLTDVVLGVAIASLLPLTVALATALLLPSMGAAARYLSDHPEYEEESREVRKLVIDKLRELHHECDEFGFKYERVTVVGHSLGSVIAYDALNHYWAEVQESVPVPGGDECSQCAHRYHAAMKLEAAAANLHRTFLGQELHHRFSDTVMLYRACQWRLYQSLAEPLACLSCTSEPSPAVKISAFHHWQLDQERWIVSDFISLGSPLHAIDFLTAESLPRQPDLDASHRSEFERKRDEREYPTCPPLPQTAAGKWPDLLNSPFPLRGPRDDKKRQDRGRRVFHNAATFAPTRWTNIYFANDLVGGPLATLFGRGVLDCVLPLGAPTPLSFLAVYPHSSYWRCAPGNPALRQACERSVEMLDALIRRPADKLVDPMPEVSVEHWFDRSWGTSARLDAGVDRSVANRLEKLDSNRAREIPGGASED